jgi:toxin YhaV
MPKGRSGSSADEENGPLVINGWTILFHDLLLDQLEDLRQEFEEEIRRREAKGKPPTGGHKGKLLFHVFDLIENKIPQDPSAEHWRQGTTLGTAYRHWRRGKTGGGRYRLFFRYKSSDQTGSTRGLIVFAWLNDEDTLRTRGGRNDAYSMFKGMLEDGNPPDAWEALVRAARQERNSQRMAKLLRTRKAAK